MHTAPGACLLYASGAVCTSNMVLEHIQFRIFFKIIMVHEHMVLDHESRLKSQKSSPFSY